MSDLAAFLTAFLTARISEDEAVAHEVQAALDGGWNYFDEIPTKLIDPARVLREAEAKRKIIERYEYAKRHEAPGNQDPDDYEMWILPPLAAVYSDHADYQEEWA